MKNPGDGYTPEPSGVDDPTPPQNLRGVTRSLHNWDGSCDGCAELMKVSGDKVRALLRERHYREQSIKYGSLCDLADDLLHQVRSFLPPECDMARAIAGWQSQLAHHALPADGEFNAPD